MTVRSRWLTISIRMEQAGRGRTTTPFLLDLPTIGLVCGAWGSDASEDSGLKRADRPPTKKRGDQPATKGGSAPAARRPARRTDDLAAHHYGATTETSGAAILSKDLSGVILSWNDSAERLFGFPAEEAVGKPITIIIPADRLNEEPLILEKINRG